MDVFDNDALLDEINAALLQSSPIAYVRPVVADGATHYAVCAADGTQLAVFTSRDAAYFSAKQHDLEPVHIH